LKQKLTYAEFVAAQEARHQQGTVAWIIERFIKEMDGTPEKPGVRPMKHYWRRFIRFGSVRMRCVGQPILTRCASVENGMPVTFSH
jgi:hypothetical protein